MSRKHSALKTSVFPSAFIAIVAIAITGCGIETSTQKPGVYSVLAQNTGSAGTQVLASPTPIASPAPAGKAPLKYLLRGVGYGSLTFTVQTLKTLKFRMTPGQQDQQVTDTSGNKVIPYYSKLGFQITVNGYTFATEMLGNGLNGSAAQTGALIDFTDRLPKLCDGVEGNCRQNVTVTIEKANNDFYCLTTGQYCPYTHVPDGYPWNATLQVQTDDTGAL